MNEAIDGAKAAVANMKTDLMKLAEIADKIDNREKVKSYQENDVSGADFDWNYTPTQWKTREMNSAIEGVLKGSTIFLGKTDLVTDPKKEVEMRVVFLITKLTEMQSFLKKNEKSLMPEEREGYKEITDKLQSHMDRLWDARNLLIAPEKSLVATDKTAVSKDALRLK